jgi:hypothetical protein
VHKSDGIEEINNGQSRKFCKNASMVRSLVERQQRVRSAARRRPAGLIQLPDFIA